MSFFGKWFKRFLVVVLMGFLVFSLILSEPALGQVVDCSLYTKPAWQNKFPIGFVTGAAPESDFFNECPKFKLFNYTYEVCAVKTLLELLKNVVLVKFILTSLQNL